MKNSNLYINPNGDNKHKANTQSLVEFFIMLLLGLGIVTMLLCLIYM